MKIYGDKQSGNCYKVVLLCALIDVPYEWLDVNILAGDTQTKDFLDKNTAGKIPLLEIAEHTYLTESNAIINYLAHGSEYLPDKPLAYAKIQQWQFFEQYSHEPYIAVARFIAKYLGLPKDRQDEYHEKRIGGYKALDIMEQQLMSTPFLTGEQFTTADISLYAYTHVANEGGFDLSTYPAITQWMKIIANHPRYIAIG